MTRERCSLCPTSMSREFRFSLCRCAVCDKWSCRSEKAVRQYMKTNYIPGISDTDMNSLLRLYPDDIRAGSPFNTGIFNAITSQFKRLAAIQGDLVFTAPRRFFLEQRSSKQPTWSFCE